MCCVDRHQPRHDTREAHKYTFDYSNSWGTWGQNSFCLRQEINKYKKKPTAWREFLSSDVILIYVDGWVAAGGSWRDVASGNNKRVGWISCSSPVCSHFAQVSVSPRDSLSLSASPAPRGLCTLTRALRVATGALPHLCDVKPCRRMKREGNFLRYSQRRF